MAGIFGELPSGQALVQQAEARFAARRAAGTDADMAEALPPAAPATPPVPEIPDEALAPYRQRGVSVDVFGPDGKTLGARGSLDDLLRAAQVGGYADHVISAIDAEGQRVGIKVADLPQALAAGIKPETSQQGEMRRFVADHKGIGGAVGVGLMNFANEALLGVPDAISRNVDPEGHARIEALRREHELAGTVGSVGGFLGGLLLPGGAIGRGVEVAGGLAARGAEKVFARAIESRLAQVGVEGAGRAVAEPLAKQALKSAAKTGVEGLAFVAPEQLTEAALGDPDHAAESMLWATGAGAALGAISPVAKGLFRRASQSVFSAPKAQVALEKYADAQAVKSFSPSKKFSDRIAEVPGGESTVGRIIREKGLLPSIGEGADALVERVAAEKEKVGRGIDQVYSQLDARGVSVSRRSVLNALREEVLAPLEAKVGFGAKAKKVASYIDDFEAKTDGKRMSAGDLLGIRMDLDKLVYGERFPSPDQVAEHYEAVRGIFKRVLDAKVERTLGAEVAGQLSSLNREYRVLSILEGASQNNVGRTIANRTNGLTDYVMGAGASGAGAAIGSALAGPLGGAVAGGAAQLVSMFGNKFLRENYNSLASKGSERLGLLFAEQANRRAARELDRVPQVLRELGSARQAPRVATSGAIARLLGDAGGSREEQFRAASDRLTELTANPDRLTASTAKVAGGFAESTPAVADALAQKQLAALQYLQATMPRAPEAPAPFAGKLSPWKPSRAELARWEGRVEVVTDPMAAFRHLRQGTLMPEHVETLKTVWPKLHEAMVRRVVQAAAAPDAPSLSRAARAQVALLTGADAGPGSARSSGARMQASYQPPKAPPKGFQADVKPAAMQTETSRISG